MVAETRGIHFYKYDEEKNHLKELKFFNELINGLWFEVTPNILFIIFIASISNPCNYKFQGLGLSLILLLW